MFCCLPVVNVLGCVLVREGNKNRQFFYGYTYFTYVQNRHRTGKPGKSYYPLPSEKKTLRTRHASYIARIGLKPRPQVPDGLPVSTYLAFWLKVPVRRDVVQKRRTFHKYTYVCRHGCIGSILFCLFGSVVRHACEAVVSI